MADPISSLRNMGPAMDAAFAKVGIHTADELHALGTDAAYAKLLAGGTRPHFIGYYVIEMALQGRPWNDCKGAEKDALRERFDRLKADGAKDTKGSDHAMEAILNEIGVIERPQGSDL
ncbi:MAG: TfoX/Sxy family protein [Pseudomonadota bacterium]